MKERITKNNWKTFLEIGAGNGYISQILLESQLKGLGCDLNASACENNKKLNSNAINQNQYSILHADFFSLMENQKFDLIIACMVIEHLSEIELDKLMEKSKIILNKKRTILFIVPSSMKHWGIEDEIAGHIKRYEFKDFQEFEKKYELKVNHISGLTFPLSNWLFRLSNYLIFKNERKVLELSPKERTVYTGNRNVPFKTTFPSYFRLILNEIVLLPFHLLQKLFRKNPNSLVIYCELQNNIK